jgi:hypothetical protein
MAADASVAASFLRAAPASVPSRIDHEVRHRQPLADPDAAARKLVEIANATAAVQDGRIHIELINRSFMEAGGTPAEDRAGLDRAITRGWLWRHESGSYVKFTPAGAELFA